jgi:predicted metalloprotease with PDZ domain
VTGLAGGSALEHGVAPEDTILAASKGQFASDLDEESPARELRLGFDPAGRLLEIVVLRFDSANELITHAMKAWRKYWSLLDES